MLITARNLKCSKCKRRLISRADKKRLYVETDRKGNLRAVCADCYGG